MVLYPQSSPGIVEGTIVIRCCHHWIIEPANGPVSRGACRYCHEVREFKNSVAEAEPDYRNPGAYYGLGFRDRAGVTVE